MTFPEFDPSKYKSISEARKDITRILTSHRNYMENILFKYCENNGGHDWWSWQDASWISAGGYYHKQEVRICSRCKLKEYRD